MIILRGLASARLASVGRAVPRGNNHLRNPDFLERASLGPRLGSTTSNSLVIMGRRRSIVNSI